MAAALASRPEVPRPARYQIPASDLAPLKQGDLDCFCGIYAAINAVRLLLAAERPLMPHEAKRLFANAITFLSLRSELACTALVGFGPRIWHELLSTLLTEVGAMKGRQLSMVVPYGCARRPLRREAFAVIETAICHHRPVLVELAGAVDHFTVVWGYTPTHLELFDSGALNRLTRKNCSVDEDAVGPRNIIMARSLTVLQLG